MDRNKRRGKYGPHESKQSLGAYDLRKSSDIAPHWMQCHFEKDPVEPMMKIPG